MNNDEAKFLLTAYRPGGRDASDPAMAEALEQAKRDPAVGGWLARAQAHDAAVAGKLRAIAPPPGLREAILAGARAGNRVRAAQPGRFWRRPVWLAAAAAVALLASVVVWRFQPARGTTFDEFAVNYVARGFMLEKRGADVAALKSWLQERGGPLPVSLPARFAELRALGCRRLQYRGKEVSLVCFEQGGREYHVFVARREDFPDSPEQSSPRWHAAESLVAAAWSDARHRYVLVSDASLPDVRKVL